MFGVVIIDAVKKTETIDNQQLPLPEVKTYETTYLSYLARSMILAVMLISLCLAGVRGAVFDPDAPLTLTLHALSGSRSGQSAWSIRYTASPMPYNFPTLTLTPDFENLSGFARADRDQR
jgi:hypothetical protein